MLSVETSVHNIHHQTVEGHSLPAGCTPSPSRRMSLGMCLTSRGVCLLDFGDLERAVKSITRIAHGSTVSLFLACKVSTKSALVVRRVGREIDAGKVAIDPWPFWHSLTLALWCPVHISTCHRHCHDLDFSQDGNVLVVEYSDRHGSQIRRGDRDEALSVSQIHPLSATHMKWVDSHKSTLQRPSPRGKCKLFSPLLCRIGDCSIAKPFARISDVKEGLQGPWLRGWHLDCCCWTGLWWRCRRR